MEAQLTQLCSLTTMQGVWGGNQCFYVFIRSPHPAGVLSLRETHRRGSKLDTVQHSMVGSEALWVDGTR